MKTTILALAGLALLAGPALADKAAADKCAAGLSGDAKTIYAAAAPGFAAASDKRGFITGKVRDLVIAGTISQNTARDSAMAAGNCLQMN